MPNRQKQKSNIQFAATKATRNKRVAATERKDNVEVEKNSYKDKILVSTQIRLTDVRCHTKFIPICLRIAKEACRNGRCRTIIVENKS